jgi:N-acetyl-anhydromuramyl-L-alanine amidase AmpD
MSGGTVADHRKSTRGRRVKLAVAAFIAPLLVAAVTVGGTAGATGTAVYLASHGTSPDTRMGLMRAAAGEFGVPVQILLAVSYQESRWEPHGDSPSVDGGYGLMDLTGRTVPADDGRGDPARPAPGEITLHRTHYTLDEAAQALNVADATLQTDERQNIRGAALLLARYARSLSGGSLPSTLGGWYGAVADYSGATTVTSARLFADGVFATLRSGASLTTTDGQTLDLPASPGAQPDRTQLTSLRLQPATATTTSSTTLDCPSTVSCRWVPAAYALNSSTDLSDYGNYDKAGRPDNMRDPSGQTVSMKISYIIIHDTEGSYAGAISTFQNSTNYVSANYVIRSSDGAITEMVRPHNVSWGAGDWWVNMHAINIEHEGFAAQGATWYTEAMYESSAKLVRYLANRYGIPLDRAHILGHDDVPGPTDYWTRAQHWDPGPFWNWTHFMALVHGVSDATERASGGSLTRGTHKIVTIDPRFSTNEPRVVDCSGGTCTTLPKQPANFVYMRTGPGSTYPLIGDPVLHPDGSSGTYIDSDWGDKAEAGERFVFAGQSGNWTAVWFRGRKAWFYNPSGTDQKARYTSGTVITPKSGLTSIPVYGAAYPQSSVYPSAVPVEQVVKLSYTISAGQAYPTAGVVPTDYYYTKNYDSSAPDDHTVIIGTTVYYQISFNHRRFFVRARDVNVQNLP